MADRCARAIVPHQPEPTSLNAVQAATHEGRGSFLVGSGRPLPGLEVEVVDDAGNCVPAGVVGEIVVRGPSVAASYWQEESSESVTRFTAEGLFTGDAGFLADGELFVLGRIAESIKLRGRTIFVEDLEARVARSLGLSVARCMVISTQHTGTDAVIAAIERPSDAQVADSAEVLRRELGLGAEVKVYSVEAGALPRTTSGKPQRKRMWQMIAAGHFDQSLPFPRART